MKLTTMMMLETQMEGEFAQCFYLESKRDNGGEDYQNQLLPLLGLWSFLREEKEKAMISQSRPVRKMKLGVKG